MRYSTEEVILLMVFSIFLSSVVTIAITCNVIYNKKTISYYKNCIVIEKSGSTISLDDCGYKRTVKATMYELAKYQLGDTIK